MSSSLRTTIASLAVIALLAGCGGSDDGAATSESDGASASSAPALTTEPPATEPPATEPSATDPQATEPQATEPPATDPPDTEPPTTESTTATSLAGSAGAGESDAGESDAGDGACLVGDWVVTEEQMNAFYTGLMATVEAPLEISVVGSAPLSFAADGTYLWAPAFSLALTAAGQSGTGVTGGTLTGEWSVADGVVTTAREVNALTVEVTVGGISFSGDELANGLLNSSPINGVAYTCGDGAPVLDFVTADPDAVVPVTLSPA